MAKTNREDVIEVELFNPETDEHEEHELPAKFEVCDRCHGKGSHVNPNVDGHGISAEEFAEDPDFAEEYMAGSYDVACEECGGLRVVKVVDESTCPKELLQRYQEQMEADARSDREDAYTRRRESGGW